MQYWPLKNATRLHHPSYLILDDRGLGIVSVKRKWLDTVLDRIEEGRLPPNAELLPNHQLLRLRSRRDSTTLVARVYGNGSREYKMCSVEERNELFIALENHPSVTLAKVGVGERTRHPKTQLALGVVAGTMLWLGLDGLFGGADPPRLVSELSIMGLVKLQLPSVLCFLVFVVTVIVGWRLWWPKRGGDVDEVLFE